MRIPVLILLIGGLAGARAGLIRVPSEQPTVAAGMDAAVNGDTVLVAPGTYFESNLNFRGKHIVLASTFVISGDDAAIRTTILDGSMQANADTATVVLFNNGEDSSSVVTGFTITGGSGTKWLDEHSPGTYREGGAVLVQYSAPTISHNIIVANQAVNTSGVTSAGGGAIRCGDSNPRILNNIIRANAGRYGGAIVLNYSGAIIRNNIIAGNTGGQDFGGAGIWILGNAANPKIVENNTITGNVSTSDGGGVLVWATSATIRNNIVWGNTAPVGPQIRLRSGGSTAASYNDVEGGWAGTENINADPLFADTSFLLSDASPCVDAGDSLAAFNDPGSGQHASWPSRGTLRNDIGVYGGPDRTQLPVINGVADVPLPPRFTLLENYPNPFNPATTIRVTMVVPGHLDLRIVDLTGREVATLAQGWMAAGAHEFVWDAAGYASGTYLLRCDGASGPLVRKLLLVK